jgi:deoxyribodipyrimidine photo-lyase
MSDLAVSSSVPPLRVRSLNRKRVNPEGEFVLYWMLANRRVRSNFALQRAVDWSITLRRPLVIFEPVGCRGHWNSDRTHAFVIAGMRDNAEALSRASSAVGYVPYAEPKPRAAAPLLDELLGRSAVVVTDDFPCYIVPKVIEAGARRSPVLCEAVDTNGLLPMRAAEQTFTTAYSFRNFLQKTLRPHLGEFPEKNPLSRVGRPPCPPELLAKVLNTPGIVSGASLENPADVVAKLPIDHGVAPGLQTGGPVAGLAMLTRFVEHRLPRYGEHRNDPDDEAASGLSPYLHFGHVGVHQIFSEVVSTEDWSVEQVSSKAGGKREGWWNLSPTVESFLDELITWRELGFNFCSRHDNYDQYESLPDWARETLEEHASDRRPVIYDFDTLDSASTHDELWNAAQRQLVREGRMHNYLRMLWGKKVLEWSPSPQEAIQHLIELNNRYAIDGRNPNSYSGIFWVFGRYDRAWGPERPIYGKIRYMTSDNTRRKLKLDRYLRTYRPGAGQKSLFS